MTYNYKQLQLNLENDEVYWLWDLIMFALDYDAANDNKKLTDEKRKFAKKLVDICDESKSF